MRFILVALILSLGAPGVFSPARAELPPAARTAHPAVQPVWRPSTRPVEVPFKLTDTNHLLIRVKINGKGPFNFIVDTGSPAMILRVPVGDQLGLKTDSRGVAYLDKLEIEGGAELHHVACLVDTPYQIEGMNAIGASGVELDGLLGYSVLAKYRLQIDLTKDTMLWTPINFTPPPLVRTRGGPMSRASKRTTARRSATTHPATRPVKEDPRDRKEANLESMGGVLKLLGPLIKFAPPVPKLRGVIGIELASDGSSVSVLKVLGGSPAALAGVRAGDRIVAVNDYPVHSITAVQEATARTLPGQKIKLTLHRGTDPGSLHLTVTAGEGL
jgi:hypothetical protein